MIRDNITSIMLFLLSELWYLMKNLCFGHWLYILISGRNQGFRHNFSSYAEWEKTYGYQLSSGSGSESDDSDLDSDEKKNAGKCRLWLKVL